MQTLAARISTVDVVRVFAILAVIIIHTVPFGDRDSIGSQFDLALALNQLGRFAVPFFFTVSGYFWARKAAEGGADHTTRLVLRLGLIFVFWSFVYLYPTDIVGAVEGGPGVFIKQVYWKVSNLVQAPFETLLQGSAAHLWFLPALALCACLSSLFAKRWPFGLLFALATVLYAIALAGKPYAASGVGFDPGFNMRNGPFFGLIFFVIGQKLHQLGPRPSWLLQGGLLAAAGLVLHFVEINLIHAAWGESLAQDFVFGTLLLGTGTAMMALSNNPVLDMPRLAVVGPLVLGIYVTHKFFVDLFRRHEWTSVRWLDDLFYVVLVLVLSALLSGAMMRHARTRRFVS